MKTCERCRKRDETVEVFERWIPMFNAPDMLFSNYWLHKKCVPGMGDVRYFRKEA